MEPIRGRRRQEKPTDATVYEQKELLRVTLSSIGDAVITTDNKGRITFLNPKAESATGWKQREALGKPLTSVFRIINEQTRRKVENPATRALKAGVIVGLANHTLLIAKDGTERPVDDSAAPIRSASGEVAGVVLVFRDVTERRWQERRIQDALAYAQNVVATVRDPLLVLDGNLRVVTASHSFYRAFKVSQDKTEGQYIYELGNRQWDIPELRVLLEKVLPEHQAFNDFKVEHDFLTIGHKVMLLNGRQVEQASNGIRNLILLAIEDITERQRLENILEDSEIRYRRLFEAAQDGILVLNMNGEIADSNPFLQQLTGYSSEELRGKHLWDIGLLTDIAENRERFHELQKKGFVRYDHLPLRTKDGQQINVEFVSNVYDVDHSRVMQCNIRDISDRVKLERETQRQAEELADLHRRKDEFLAMLSHELRNPLAPIANAIHLLDAQRNPTIIQRQATGVIQRQTAQLTRLVDDLLEVSRITTGRIQLRLERIAIGSILERAVESVSSQISERQHKMRVSVSPDPIWVNADSARLEQVIVNLLVNAAKYTPAGGQIWATLSQEDHHAVVRVRDTGVGIAPDTLPRLFDLFTQGERSLARSEGGLGIGLALVRKLTQMHGGTVEAYSVLGQGSEFVVRLPVVSDGEPAQEPSPPGEKTTPPELSLRVLVVDDNKDNSETLTVILKLWGYDVRQAEDGPTALDTALNYLPDVVLLDLGLPVMDGYEVARQIREQQTLRDTVLVAVTGYGHEGDRQRTKEAGFYYHLVKPTRLEELRDVLVTIAKDKSLARAQRNPPRVQSKRARPSN